MDDHELFHQYLDDHRWGKAYEWVETKVRVFRNKVNRRRTASYVFAVPMAVIVAFFTWVVLYPSADKKELEAFPLVTICNDLFLKLCEAVPYGKPAVIGGLIALPFVAGAVLALVSLVFRPKPFTSKDKKVHATPALVRERLELLEKLRDKYQNGYMTAFFLSFVLIVLLTGITMTISAVPGGLNPFEYLVVGAICAAVQAGVVFVCMWVFSWFCPDKEEWDSLGIYNCHRQLDRLLEKDKPKRETYVHVSDRVKETEYYKEKYNEYYAQYTGTEYETPEQKAARLADEVILDLSGDGKWDY